MKKHRHTINVLLTVLLNFMMAGLFIDMWWFTTDNMLQIQHFVCILLTFGALVTLFINQNLFTLILGVTLVVGNFGGLSCFHSISTVFFGFHIGSIPIPLYYGQPEYSFLLFIYLVFNKDFYTGIATKEYWRNFFTRTQDLEAVLTVINIDNKQNDNETAVDNTTK